MRIVARHLYWHHTCCIFFVYDASCCCCCFLLCFSFCTFLVCSLMCPFSTPTHGRRTTNLIGPIVRIGSIRPTPIRPVRSPTEPLEWIGLIEPLWSIEPIRSIWTDAINSTDLISDWTDWIDSTDDSIADWVDRTDWTKLN